MRLIRDAVPSSVDVPSSGRLMTGPTCGSVPRRAYRSVHTLSHVRLDVQRHCTVCERFPTCRHAVVAQIHEVIAPCLFRLRSKSHRPVHHRHAVCHLRSRVQRCCFTEPINSLFSRSHSTISGLHSHHESHCLIQFQRSPTP